MFAKKLTDPYRFLFERNQPMISESIQNKVSGLRLLVAGCGSTGGAFIEGAMRLGVRNFKLADCGQYENNNLNRQFVFQKDLGKNKAEVYGQKIRELNSHNSVMVDSRGLVAENAAQLMNQIDLIFDAVDVTTTSGVKNKLLLHEMACAQRLPVLSALDLGFKQWLRTYDYRKKTQPLAGQLAKARRIKHPLKAVIEGFCPIEEFSVETSEEVLRLLSEPGASACQLACACFLLAAYVTPYLIRHVEELPIPEIVALDLNSLFASKGELRENEALRQRLNIKLKAKLLEIE